MIYNWQSKRPRRRYAAAVVLVLDFLVAVAIWRFVGLPWALAWFGWTRLASKVNAVGARVDDLIEYHRYREATGPLHWPND